MITAISLVALAGALVLAVPAILFYAEVLLALKSNAARVDASPRGAATAAILVPAHNESQNLVPTLQDIRAQLEDGDRVVVVADNCTDDTADVARACQAEVIVRDCPDKRGKSYALDWGVRHLGDARPDVVIIVDADCRLSPQALPGLKQACLASHRPVQALYLMEADPASASDHAVSRFAWLVKNLVRPLGLRAAGLPCQLMGTGMALPAKLLDQVDLATGHLTEDVCLGLACARAGRPPLFLPDAVVHSTFAKTDDATRSQRRRWEHGHLQLILSEAIPSMVRGMQEKNLPLVALALDLLVPPVTLLGFLLVISFMFGFGTWLLGGAAVPVIVSSVSVLAFGLGLATAWIVFGRRVLPFRKLLLLPWYALEKVALYSGLFSKGFETRWVRTERK